jgi:hypothetical protein
MTLSNEPTGKSSRCTETGATPSDAATVTIEFQPLTDVIAEPDTERSVRL